MPIPHQRQLWLPKPFERGGVRIDHLFLQIANQYGVTAYTPALFLSRRLCWYSEHLLDVAFLEKCPSLVAFPPSAIYNRYYHLDHAGTENTRIFREVAEVEKLLERLDYIVGTTVPAQAAIIYNWENRWALEEASDLRTYGEKKYEETCKNHHYPLWAMGIPVDVIDMEQDFSKYRLIIAPLLYMVRPGVAERLESFVRNGGILVATYWSGIIDENDLCFLGGFPGPLRNLLGIWSEEIDSLYPEEKNHIAFTAANELGLSGEYETKHIASRNEERFLRDFYGTLADQLKIKKAIETDLPEGVSAQMRTDGSSKDPHQSTHGTRSS